jgi:hypothetical protein
MAERIREEQHVGTAAPAPSEAGAAAAGQRLEGGYQDPRER